MDYPDILTPKRFINVKTHGTGGGTLGSAVWPTANKAVFIPIKLVYSVQLKRFIVMNGATVSGNFDVGIYSLDGCRIASSGSVAQSGVSTLQYVTASPDKLITPGSYFLALVMDNITGTMNRSTQVNTNETRGLGMLEQATAFPLPNPATFAQMSLTYIPFIGFTSTDTGF